MKLLRMLLSWRGLAIAAVLASTYGCPDNCLQIQDDLCNCYGKTTEEISACETNASTQEAVSPPNSQQLEACGQIVNGCNDIIKGGDACQTLQTIAGRQACGLTQTDTQADAG